MKELTSLDKLDIYIPSLGRCGRVLTLDHIPGPWLKHTYIVVNTDEQKQYKKEYGDDMIMVSPVNGIASVRQWVLENCLSRYALFLDDDMSFSHRTSEKKLKKTRGWDVKKMLQLLISWLDEGFAHVGISPRFGNFQVEEPWVEVGRMNNAYAYNVDTFLTTGVRFDRLEVMEDFDVTLSLLEKGFPNRITYEYAWAQKKSGDVGGCSAYRTSQMQEKAAHELKKLHPKYVKVVQKESKVKWEGFDSKIRTDVNISWKKAYRVKIDKNKGISRFL